MSNEKEDRLKELGKIYGFETDQQRSVRILNKIINELEKEIDSADTNDITKWYYQMMLPDDIKIKEMQKYENN